MRRHFIIAVAIVMAAACGTPAARQDDIALVPSENFDTTLNGVKVGLYTLKAGDITLQVTNLGGRVVTLFAPDKDGKMADIVVGRPTVAEYLEPEGERFLGACVGPVANRIGRASFKIGDEVYNLPTNDNDVNTLHGGYFGLDLVPWTVADTTSSSITLTYTRPDGFEGFPGNLSITMTYALTEANEFEVRYSAVTDKATPVNISHHSFFNLRGEGEGDVMDYVMTINASQYTPIDELSIPLGENESVEGTPFDFREPHALGERVDDTTNVQICNARGYDHNWVLDRKSESGVETACTVWDPQSGRFLEVLTDQPGLQFYSGNFFKGQGIGVSGKPMEYRSSIALETQHFPDSPNRPNFPSVLLEPGQTYTHYCAYRFSVK